MLGALSFRLLIKIKIIIILILILTILEIMAVSILEALQNANANLDNVKVLGMAVLPMAKSQLQNAVTLLEKGYDIHTEVEPLLEKYGDVENVPDLDED